MSFIRFRTYFICQSFHFPLISIFFFDSTTFPFPFKIVTAKKTVLIFSFSVLAGYKLLQFLVCSTFPLPQKLVHALHRNLSSCKYLHFIPFALTASRLRSTREIFSQKYFWRMENNLGPANDARMVCAQRKVRAPSKREN